MKNNEIIRKIEEYFEVPEHVKGKEVLVSDAILYVNRVEKGWLNALPINSKKIINLPLHLKVQLERTENKR